MIEAGREGALEQGELQLLADLSETFALSLDIEKTLKQAVVRIAEYMEAEAASVFLLEEDGSALRCRACEGPVDILGLTIPLGRGIVGRTFQENRPQMVRDARNDPDFSGQVDAESGFRTRSLLCAPLSTGRGVIGVLEVLNKRGDRLFDRHDLEVLRVLAAPTALALSNAALARDLVEQNRIRRELELARKMQRSLFPKRRRGGFPLRAVNLPAREISGDFYDYFDLADGRIAFTVGDVSGKGLDAALLMVRCASLLRWAGKDGLPPSQWLQRVNEELCETVSGGMFVCVLAGYYQPETRRLEWSNGGFPPGLLQRSGVVVRQFLADGPPLGILSGTEYPSQALTLQPDEALYFYSDGVSDVRDADGKTLGVEGVERLLDDHADLPPEARLRAITAALRRLKLLDDTTLLLIEDRPDPEKLLLDMRMSADPALLKNMRERLQSALRRQSLGKEAIEPLVLAVHEACCNIIRHGYGGACEQQIGLRLTRDSRGLVFTLRDDAEPVNPTCIRPRDLSEARPGGLGINFIDSVMDGWGFRRPRKGRGNILWMRKLLRSDSPPEGK